MTCLQHQEQASIKDGMNGCQLPSREELHDGSLDKKLASGFASEAGHLGNHLLCKPFSGGHRVFSSVHRGARHGNRHHAALELKPVSNMSFFKVFPSIPPYLSNSSDSRFCLACQLWTALICAEIPVVLGICWTRSTSSGVTTLKLCFYAPHLFSFLSQLLIFFF